MPEPTVRAARRQRRALAEQRRDCNSHVFFDLLTRPELLDTVEELLPEHRERRFPPTRTLSLFLAQAMSDDGSCQRVLNELAVRCIDTPPPSPSTGSYCQARGRLPLELPRRRRPGPVRGRAEALDRWPTAHAGLARQPEPLPAVRQPGRIGFPCARGRGSADRGAAGRHRHRLRARAPTSRRRPSCWCMHDNDVLLGRIRELLGDGCARGARRDGVFAAHGGRKLTRGKRFRCWSGPNARMDDARTARQRAEDDPGARVEIRHAGETPLTTLVDLQREDAARALRGRQPEDDARHGLRCRSARSRRSGACWPTTCGW